MQCLIWSIETKQHSHLSWTDKKIWFCWKYKIGRSHFWKVKNLTQNSKTWENLKLERFKLYVKQAVFIPSWLLSGRGLLGSEQYLHKRPLQIKKWIWGTICWEKFECTLEDTCGHIMQDIPSAFKPVCGITLTLLKMFWAAVYDEQLGGSGD